MTRTTGISDKVKILDSGSSEVSFGFIQSASHRIDNRMETRAGVGGGTSYQYHFDRVVEISGSIDTFPTSLEILKIFGSYSSGSVTFTDTLPEHTIQMNTDGSNYIEITGAKFGSFTLEITKGEEVKLSVDFMGKSAEVKSGTISYSMPSVDPLNFLDAKVKIGGSYVGSLETTTIKYNRDLEAVRGIENVSDGDKRKPSEIIEKLKNITFDMTIEITDNTAWTQVMGGSTIQDSRSDVTIVIETANGDITITGCRVNDLDSDKGADGEIRTAKISGNALGMSVSGVS